MALNHESLEPKSQQKGATNQLEEISEDEYFNSIQRKLNSQKNSKTMGKAPSSICADHRLYLDLKTKEGEHPLIYDQRCMMLASNVFRSYKNGIKNLFNRVLLRKDDFKKAVEIYETECSALGWLRIAN